MLNAEVKAHLPEPAGNALPKAAQESAGHKGALLAHVQLIQEHPSSPLQRCFPVSQLPMCAVAYIHHLLVQDFALFSVELHQVPGHSFLHPVETPLNVDTQPVLPIPSASLLRLYSVSLTRSLTKLLNSTGPSTVLHIPCQIQFQIALAFLSPLLQAQKFPCIPSLPSLSLLSLLCFLFS